MISVRWLAFGLMVASIGASNATPSAATTPAFSSVPSPSTVAGTVTVIDGTPTAPWYLMPELIAWLGPLATLAVGLVAACIALRQVARQHRNELKLQSENYRNEFRLSVYREVSDALDATAHPLGRVAVLGGAAAQEVELGQQLRQGGIEPAPFSNTAGELIEVHHRARMDVMRVLMLIERYLIVEPRMKIFCTALNAAVHDIHARTIALLAVLQLWFPIQRRAGVAGPDLVNVKPVPLEVAGELRNKGDALQVAVFVLNGYLDDIRRELQHRLLGGLFDGKIPPRQPLDPSVRVLSLEDADLTALGKYFLDETDWGRSMSVALKDAQRRFGVSPVPRADVHSR